MSFRSLDAASDDRAAPPLAGGERYRGVLDELVDLGMDLARMVHRRAAVLDAAAGEAGAAGDSGVAVAEATVAFDRIARTVRRTVALLRVLDVPVAPVVERRALVRRQVIRAVEDTIEADHGDGERAESLRAELYERMDAPEFEEDLGRPVEEVIADIRRDLGIAGRPGMRHPWKRRTPGEVSALFARASSRGAAVEARMVTSAPFRGG